MFALQSIGCGLYQARSTKLINDLRSHYENVKYRMRVVPSKKHKIDKLFEESL
jgi:chaperonin cofactor prefoldin